MNIDIFGALQRLADAAVVVISFAFGYWLYHFNGGRSVPYQSLEFLGLGVLTALLFVIVFQSMRLYERKVSLLHVVETRRILIGWAEIWRLAERESAFSHSGARGRICRRGERAGFRIYAAP